MRSKLRSSGASLSDEPINETVKLMRACIGGPLLSAYPSSTPSATAARRANSPC